VKDSLATAETAIELICMAKDNLRYIVYNDYSNKENRKHLEAKTLLGYELINLEDLIDSPSPNYRFTLIDAQKKALASKSGLLIVESDVYIERETILALAKFANKTPQCGMVAAITVDESGTINFPYKHIVPNGNDAIETSHRLSFCCTLLTNRLLQKLDFEELSLKKDWFDVQISRDSRNSGFINYVLPNVKVKHLPHSSRPWKQLKYTHPLKYYFRKWFKGKDKI
jgi:hypothetical protein